VPLSELIATLLDSASRRGYKN